MAEAIGADGRRLLEGVYAQSALPWLRELDAIETLRRVWLQHYHAHEQQTPWRADGELPPSALLITSPYDVEARVRPQEKHSMERIQSAFHRDL